VDHVEHFTPDKPGSGCPILCALKERGRMGHPIY
jgi:hypothetical protein